MADDRSKRPTPIPATTGSTKDIERRSVHRYPFIAPVELKDLSSGARRSARTSDLSLGGCYIDILDPFPSGTLVHLQISRDKGAFEARGRVIASRAGFWMSIAFSEMMPDQRLVLEGWLAELDTQLGPGS